MTRPAATGDLDAVAALTAMWRRRLAEWSPRWWRPAPHADELHRAWLAHLIEDPAAVVRVVTEHARVVGCAASTAQAGGWLVDDVALARDERWADIGVELLAAVAERPALTCVPTSHLARRAASEAAGLHHASSIWLRETAARSSADVAALPRDVALPPAPAHPFAGPLDPQAPGALTLTGADGGVLVGSPPITAPPVYDPGGTVAVVDRVAGEPGPLLEQALAASGARGDVLLAVVAAVDDDRLRSDLKGLHFERTVDVFTWPPPGRPRRRR
jgi:hypothetical protein